MKADKLFILFLVVIFIAKESTAQTNRDSTIISSDSLQHSDSITPVKTNVTFDSFLKKNKYINVKASPVSLGVKEKNRTGKELLFYLLGIVILLFALFKVFYTKYFNNIFRVFFNTSLRQNQLTDILLQAKLPSLIFNVFFVISAGLYAWLLLDHYHLLNQNDKYILLALCILFMGIIYFGKFISLKLIGWITGTSTATDQYIFVIFLINKIMGFFLIPFIVLLAFAPVNWLPFIMASSFLVIGILFLLRYIRSYGLLQNQLRINTFHFLLYIVGMELLPILLIYKLVSTIIL